MDLSICMFSRSTPPFAYGGIETYTKELSEKLARLGCNVTLICKQHSPNIKNYVDVNGVMRYFVKSALIPTQSLENISYSLNAFERAMELGDFDIYHGQYIYGFGCALAKMLHIAKKPFVNTVHNLILRDMILSLGGLSFWNRSLALPLRSIAETVVQTPLALAETEIICKMANRIIAVSNSTKEDCIAICDVPETRIKVIPNGVNTERFNPKLSGERIRSLLNVQSAPLILYVGGLDARKGVDYLALSSKRILRVIKDAKFLIVGKGPRERHLKELLKELQVQESFIFLPNVNDTSLPYVYAAADVFVLPSLWEGFGISLTEAMSSGLPVVATNVSAIPEIVFKNENGLLFEPENHEQLAEYIIMLLTDKSLSRRLGLNARRTMEKYFSWEIIAKKTLQVYNATLR